MDTVTKAISGLRGLVESKLSATMSSVVEHTHGKDSWMPSGPDSTLDIGDDELHAIFDHLAPVELLQTAALVCRRW
jgi:hypothetical protein